MSLLVNTELNVVHADRQHVHGITPAPLQRRCLHSASTVQHQTPSYAHSSLRYGTQGVSKLAAVHPAIRQSLKEEESASRYNSKQVQQYSIDYKYLQLALPASIAEIACKESPITQLQLQQQQNAPPLPPVAICSSKPAVPGTMHTWQWRGHHNIAYETYGSGDIPVVLVHGMGACHEHWNKLIPEMGPQYRVYALDLLGFGDSDKPPAASEVGPRGHFYNYDTWSSQIRDFINEVVRAPAILVGNSAGGLASLQTATAAPHLVRGLVLLSCTMRHMHERNQPLVLQPFVALFQWMLHETPVGRLVVDWVLKTPGKLQEILQSAYGDPNCLSPQLLASFREHLSAEGSREVLLDVITNSTGPLAQDFLPINTVPTIVVWGSADPWEPVAAAEKIFSGYAADFVVLPGVGHFPQDEVPSLIAAMLDHFAEECAIEADDGAGGSEQPVPGQCLAVGDTLVEGFSLRGLMAAAELDAKV